MKLHLDLAHPQPRPSWLGWGLLALGVAAALWSGWRYTDGAQRLQQAREQVAGLSPKPSRAARPGDKAVQESALAKNARRALGADWSGLLARLEQSRPKQVALLSLEVDAAQGRLNLEADAKDLAAMLAYLQDLETAGLADVRLQSHTAMVEEGQEYVHFRATAGWGAPEARP